MDTKFITVGSCKGGVGKSTCTLLCALSLSKTHKVGILDADLYGSNTLEICGITKHKSSMQHVDLGSFQCLSLASVRPHNQPLIWRGPLLHKTLQSMLSPKLWEGFDVVFVDIPPGTGDIALTLAKQTPISGHILVTTPHTLAVNESTLFADFCKKMHIPLIGTILNMDDLYTPCLELEKLIEKSPLLTKINHHAAIAQNSCSSHFITTCYEQCPDAIKQLTLGIIKHLKNS